MKKKTIAMYALLSAVGLGILGTGAASANGLWGFGPMAPEDIGKRQTALFEQQSQLLGIGIEDVKNAWAEGKDMRQIAEERGITQEQLRERMKDAMTAQLKEQLQVLVAKGVITQAQADKRQQFMQNAPTSRKYGKSMGMMGKRGHHGFGFGF